MIARHGSCTTGLFGQSKWNTIWFICNQDVQGCNWSASSTNETRANRFAGISARYKIGKERAQGEESRLVPPLRNLEPTRATHGENLPSEYGFALRACYETECNHPVCQIERPTDELVWYTGRPSVRFLPLPWPDPKHPWGSKECKNCNGSCTGHFMCLENGFSHRQQRFTLILTLLALCYQEKVFWKFKRRAEPWTQKM